MNLGLEPFKTELAIFGLSGQWGATGIALFHAMSKCPGTTRLAFCNILKKVVSCAFWFWPFTSKAWYPYEKYQEYPLKAMRIGYRQTNQRHNMLSLWGTVFLNNHSFLPNCYEYVLVGLSYHPLRRKWRKDFKIWTPSFKNFGSRA